MSIALVSIAMASSWLMVHKPLEGVTSVRFLTRGSSTCVGDLLLLMAVRVNDGLELEVTDPKEHKGDVEQEEG